MSLEVSLEGKSGAQQCPELTHTPPTAKGHEKRRHRLTRLVTIKGFLSEGSVGGGRGVAWMSSRGLGLKILGEPGGCTGATRTYIPRPCPCTTGIDTEGVGWVQVQLGASLSAFTASLSSKLR